MSGQPPSDTGKRRADLRQETELLQFHMLQENAKSFRTIARYVRRSFQTTYLMNVTLFIIGIAAFVAAIVKGYSANDFSEAVPALIYGGLSVSSFVVAFVFGPIRSIEKDSIWVTWLLTVFNTYLYRVVYMKNPETVDQDLVAAEKGLVERLRELSENLASSNGSWNGRAEPETEAARKEPVVHPSGE